MSLCSLFHLLHFKMRTIVSIFLTLLVSVNVLFAQTSADIIVTPYPFGINDEITITIKSKNSCNDLSAEKMYIHSGIGTETAPWTYVVGNWGQDDGVGLMTNNGDGTHSIKLTPKTYYSIPDDQDDAIKKMGMVFRNADGSKKYKYSVNNTCTDVDYFVSVGAFQLTLVSPVVADGGIVQMNSGDNLNIHATSSETADFTIKEGTIEVATAAAVKEIDFNKTLSATNTYTVTADNGNEIKSISFTVIVSPDPAVAELPAGIRDGINYYPDDDTKVTLVLHAPNKSFVYVKGDFNNWQLNDDYLMNVTKVDKTNPDTKYWITITGLTPGKEYAFQYVVDGEKIIADPYTEKILDPWNDKYIPADVYPDLKPYPEGKTEGIVSIFQTAQQKFDWQYSDYKKPPKENLIIYELLVRDFVHMHDYNSILDTINYLDRLNVNAIELMPINEFEGNDSWGYNPSFLFAPDKYYGTKETLKRFIDEAHSRGIAVIIDIVMNHAFGQSPFVQLYNHHDENGEIVFDEPTPWFNERSPNQTYKWGADFNHESIYTQQLLDSINRFWMEEYKIDGFRFDFTKGFTNTPGDGWAYDASRIAILERMYNRIMEKDTTAYVILEHLTDNSEEKDLAGYGLMLWGNMVNNYSEAAMGWNEGDKSDLGWACYRNRGWSKPNLVSYSSSHDEERIAYKLSQWGNSSGSYNIKEHPTAMERMQLQAMFLYTIPGPKMIWQFDELGYDISIDDPCRVCNKPILWEYTKDRDRTRVYNLHRYMFNLKKSEPAFQTTDFSLDVDNGAIKSIVLKHDDMNVVVIGNFDVITHTNTFTFPSTGTWYDYFAGTEVEISTPEQSIELQPGEYRMYTTKQFEKPNLDEYISTDIREIPFEPIGAAKKLNIFPMPAKNYANIQYLLLRSGPVTVDIFNMNGEKVESMKFRNQVKGPHTIRWEIRGGMTKGIYLIRVSTENEILTGKIIVM